MVGPSKILTVSYGTFSCTLEGFDDPFSTMKSIAEYFRDLAADDRYFGAEPPQPDPAMLHRIAEREVHRRVEARVQENGVILRAADAPAGSVGTAPPVTPSYMSATAASPLSESVAAKLQRLRHAAATTPSFVPAPEEAEILPEPTPEPAVFKPAQQVQAFAPVAEPVAEVAAEPVAEATIEAPAAEPVVEAVAEPEVEAVAEPAIEADLAPVAEAAIEAPAAEPVVEAVAEPEVEAVAEPVIEAVAAPVEDAAPETIAPEAADEVQPEAAFAGMAEDIDAEAVMAEAVEDWDQPETEEVAATPDAFEDDDDLMESLAAALAGPADEMFAEAPTAATAAAEPTLALEDDDDLMESLAAALAAPSAPAEVVAEVADEAADDDGMMDALADDAEAPVVEAVAETEATEAPAAEAMIEAEAEAVVPEAEAVQDVAPEAITEPAPEPAQEAAAAEIGESPASAKKLQRARARVIKIRRADAAQSVAPVDAEAEAAAETSQDSEATRPEAPARALLPDVAAETSMQRLIEQTNSQLDGAESRRRLAAIEHLKAAVAATAAERAATGGAEDPAGANLLNVYRSDLERVVRPRRPTTASGHETTAVPLRPAPLVLVSAQRIDRPAAPVTAVAPVRPRRVGGGSALAMSPETQPEEDEIEEDENLFSPAGGFAEFAERLGAQELPDLLEAAVAYAACVEGRPHVSRPYMLRQVGALSGSGEADRDEMLKGFGRLLRGGRIEKVRAGLYALPGSSRVMAEAKKLAN